MTDVLFVLLVYLAIILATWYAFRGDDHDR